MILLTGGAGFIGSQLLKFLNAQGIKDILIVDRLGHKNKWKNLMGTQFADFIHADELFTSRNLELTSLPIHFVFHLGACSSTTQTNADYLLKNNFEFSQKIFNLALEKRAPLVYASSAATYGNGELGYSDEMLNLNQLKPLNPYGFSKHIFDQWILSQSLKDLIPWYGIKFFNVFGPGEDHKEDMRSIVHKAYGQIQASGRVRLFQSHHPDFKDGEQLRDFIYVKDACKALYSFYLKAQEVPSGLYNLGTGKAHSFRFLVENIFKALNKEVAIDYIPMPQEIRGQYQYFTEASMQKFHSSFDFFKFTAVEDCVSDYVLHYLKNS